MLTLGIDNCIYLYPMKEWEVFMEKLAKLPISDPKARNFARNFTGNAEECEVDRQGRITLPQNLREQTGMVKELTTIGCMNKIEIWSREEYEAPEIRCRWIGRDSQRNGGIWNLTTSRCSLMNAWSILI